MMLLTVHKIWCVLKWYQISLLINIKDNLYWGDHVITTKHFLDFSFYSESQIWRKYQY